MRLASARPVQHAVFQLHHHLREALGAPEGETYPFCLWPQISEPCLGASVLTTCEKVLTRLNFYFYGKTTGTSRTHTMDATGSYLAGPKGFLRLRPHLDLQQVSWEQEGDRAGIRVPTILCAQWPCCVHCLTPGHREGRVLPADRWGGD